jgi:hypothetical protein
LGWIFVGMSAGNIRTCEERQARQQRPLEVLMHCRWGATTMSSFVEQLTSYEWDLLQQVYVAAKNGVQHEKLASIPEITLPPRRTFPPRYRIVTYASYLAILDIAPWQPEFMYPLRYRLVHAAEGILEAIS